MRYGQRRWNTSYYLESPQNTNNVLIMIDVGDHVVQDETEDSNSNPFLELGMAQSQYKQYK